MHHQPQLFLTKSKLSALHFQLKRHLPQKEAGAVHFADIFRAA
jgi:hypothetical protein